MVRAPIRLIFPPNWFLKCNWSRSCLWLHLDRISFSAWSLISVHVDKLSPMCVHRGFMCPPSPVHAGIHSDLFPNWGQWGHRAGALECCGLRCRTISLQMTSARKHSPGSDNLGSCGLSKCPMNKDLQLAGTLNQRPRCCFLKFLCISVHLFLISSFTFHYLVPLFFFILHPPPLAFPENTFLSGTENKLRLWVVMLI